MADEQRVELPGVLESILRYCLKEGQERMSKGEALIPFSALAAGETLFCEQHNCDSPEACMMEVRQTVEHAQGSQGYGFCYDGYVNTEDGTMDAIIAQGGVPGDPTGYAIATVYTKGENEALTFEEEPIFLGNCPNFMALLMPLGGAPAVIGLDDKSSSVPADLETAFSESGSGGGCGCSSISFDPEEFLENN